MPPSSRAAASGIAQTSLALCSGTRMILSPGAGGTGTGMGVVMKLSRSFVILGLVLALLLFATGVTLARSDGVSRASATASAASAKGASVIMWNQAKSYVGLTKTVKGAVKGTTYASSTSGQPTFLNIGKNYPNRARFTVVIWGKYRSAFPSNLGAYCRGKTVLATGRIRMYQGSAQMFISSPSKLRIAN
jgi:hypothetical protein